MQPLKVIFNLELFSQISVYQVKDVFQNQLEPDHQLLHRIRVDDPPCRVLSIVIALKSLNSDVTQTHLLPVIVLQNCCIAGKICFSKLTGTRSHIVLLTSLRFLDTINQSSVVVS